MDLHLQGRSALITGGSRGIGLGVARLLAQEGCNLHLAARNRDTLEHAHAHLTRDHGVQVMLHAGDLSDPGYAIQLAQDCGPVDILINNAGAIPQSDIAGMDDAAWRRSWDLKVFGFINLTREVYRQMCANRRGVIINVVGIAGERPLPNYLAGSMANASLMAMSRGLGVDSIRHGVRVVAVNPGNTETDRQVVRWKARARDKFGDESRWRELTTDFPLGRLAKVDEVASTIVFLCSDRSGYTNATVVTVDGGWTAMR